MGVVECVKHDLMQPFQVLYERDGKKFAFEPSRGKTNNLFQNGSDTNRSVQSQVRLESGNFGFRK